MTWAVRGGALLTALLFLQACSREEPAPPPLADQAAEPRIRVVETPLEGSVDPESGLIIEGQWELVKAHCGVCHSTRLITQNRGDRETWLSLIRWMQESQGLWDFDPATESGILDYLASNYAPPQAGRRPPLDASLLPPNPWEETP